MNQPGESTKPLAIQFLEEKGEIRTIEEALRLEAKYRSILIKPATMDESGVVLQYMIDNGLLKL